MIDFQGLTLNGFYLGTRIQNSKPDQNGQTKQTLYAGVEVTTAGAYGEDKKEVLEAVISDALIKAGVAQKLAKFEGQFISIPVWGRVWQGQKSAGVTYYVDKQVEKLGA